MRKNRSVTWNFEGMVDNNFHMDNIEIKRRRYRKQSRRVQNYGNNDVVYELLQILRETLVSKNIRSCFKRKCVDMSIYIYME